MHPCLKSRLVVLQTVRRGAVPDSASELREGAVLLRRLLLGMANRTHLPAGANRGPRFPPGPLTRREVRRACSRRGYASIRDAALIALLAGTGLRIAEALALRPVDVDLEQATVRVLHGKGDRSRLVGLDAAAQALRDRWLDRRSRLGVGRPAPIFCAIASHQRSPAPMQFGRRDLTPA